MKEMPQSSLRRYQKIGARSWRLEAKSLYPPTPPARFYENKALSHSVNSWLKKTKKLQGGQLRKTANLHSDLGSF